MHFRNCVLIMTPWKVLFLLSIAVNITCNAKAQSKRAEIKFGKSDCSNTINIEKFDAPSHVSFSPEFSLADIAYFEFIDNDTKAKKSTRNGTQSFVIKPCKKEPNESKTDRKCRLRRNCSKSHAKGTPWHVIIYRTDESMYFCQGVLIDTNWVLTVAHCLVGHDSHILKPDTIKVVAKGLSERIPVTNIFIHESFRYATFTHDIALLKIKPSSSSITPICLPDKAAANLNSFTLAWWEGDVFDDTFQGEFFQGKAKSMKSRDCKSKIVQQAISYSFDSWHICSENPDYCSGDMWMRMSDASPLYSIEEQNAVLVGLKSWGTSSFSCEAGSETQVHIDVFKYMNWITSNLNLLSGRTMENITEH